MNRAKKLPGGTCTTCGACRHTLYAERDADARVVQALCANCYEDKTGRKVTGAVIRVSVPRK